MKQKRTLFTGIAIGVLTSFLVSMMVVPGFAAGIRKTITAYVGDIDIYVDNVLKIPTDANGNRVEPMIYDGTTYLPVRAISNMLGEEVTWDGDTRSIYIGEKPSHGSKSVPLDSLKIIDSQDMNMYQNSTISILGEEFSVFNSLGHNYRRGGWGTITYKLDSNYESLHGKFVVANDDWDRHPTGSVRFYNVDRYGTETLIKEYNASLGDNPINVTLDVAGCNFLKIMIDHEDEYEGATYLYDISLTTAN